ncbi:MAG: 16S rRNA (guanine(527)-N(7))-methyltransferase RsmG, partial [Moraxellaceae bacterium]
AKPVHTRVEDTAMLAQLGQFAVVTSRAFASLTDFVTLGQPFLAPNGHFAAMKGVVPQDELQQLSQYQTQVIALKVPQLNEQRHLILMS